MRALRFKPNKRATIYDLVGNVFTHGLPTQYSNWELAGTMRKTYKQADEVMVRMCDECYRVYAGVQPLCPYCEHDNGKTQAEIKADEKAELERIEDLKRKEQRIEQGRAQTLDELIELGRKRGYKNPSHWARRVYNNRRNKI